MKNPWARKNPFLSMWLSGANAVAGAARTRGSAALKRQTSTAVRRAQTDIADAWIASLAPKQKSLKSTKRKKRR
jgi:hypothetical protein